MTQPDKGTNDNQTHKGFHMDQETETYCNCKKGNRQGSFFTQAIHDFSDMIFPAYRIQLAEEFSENKWEVRLVWNPASLLWTRPRY